MYMKSLNMKLSRELRLAYLAHLAYSNLSRGLRTKTNWPRHYRLTTALDSEILSNTITGFWVGKRIVRIGKVKSYDAN